MRPSGFKSRPINERRKSVASLARSRGLTADVKRRQRASRPCNWAAKLGKSREPTGQYCPGRAITTLAHHIDLGWLREAHRKTRKDGARGVDGQSTTEWEAHLEENLQRLLDRAKSGSYRAPPVRRVDIPKANGKEMRPLGIPTFEDKVLQRAVTMLLEAVYEQDFGDCSYGFRHPATDTIAN